MLKTFSERGVASGHEAAEQGVIPGKLVWMHCDAHHQQRGS